MRHEGGYREKEKGENESKQGGKKGRKNNLELTVEIFCGAFIFMACHTRLPSGVSACSAPVCMCVCLWGTHTALWTAINPLKLTDKELNVHLLWSPTHTRASCLSLDKTDRLLEPLTTCLMSVLHIPVFVGISCYIQCLCGWVCVTMWLWYFFFHFECSDIEYMV